MLALSFGALWLRAASADAITAGAQKSDSPLWMSTLEPPSQEPKTWVFYDKEREV